MDAIQVPKNKQEGKRILVGQLQAPPPFNICRGRDTGSCAFGPRRLDLYHQVGDRLQGDFLSLPE